MTFTLPRALGSTPSAIALSALVGSAGVLHFKTPRAFADLIPKRLGDPRPWVAGSGVVEIACAVALAVPATRRVGALATAGLFVAVFPGNVTMALKSHPGSKHLARNPWVAWGRLPLQVPLVVWAAAVASGASKG